MGFEPTSVHTFMAEKSCLVQLSKDFGTFSPPVVSGKTNVNLWCNWTILAAPGKHIVIYIDGFQTNTNCDDNRAQIIFERISSSVETTIVSACWNKPTHVFAAQALAVNVVLLWQTFSPTDSLKYFEGRYYIFDDPAAGLNAHLCNCSLKPYKSVTVPVATTVLGIPPTNVRPVYSSLPSTLSISKLPYVSTKVSEAYHDGDHEVAIATPQPPLHVAHYLTAGTFAINLSKDVPSTVVQVPSPPSKVVQPQSSHSSVMDEDKPIDIETTEDLQPSYVGQWETTSQPNWILGKILSMSEAPVLSTAHIEIPVAPHFSGAHDSTLHVTPHFSTTYLTDLPMTVHYGTAHDVGLHKATPISIPYTAKLPKTPHFGLSHTEPDGTEQFSETNNIQVSTPFTAALLAELTKIHNFSEGQFMMTPPVSAAHQTEFPRDYVTSIVKRPKIPKTSHVNTDQIIDAPKTVLDLLYIESHLEKPTSVPPLSWKKPSLPAVTATAETMKPVFTADGHTIETSTAAPLISPAQFTSLPVGKFPTSQGGISHPTPQALLPTTKSLSKDLGSQTVTEPEKTQVFQPVSFSTVHPENNLQKAKTVSAVLGFHINVLGSSYSTSLPAAKPIVSGSPPQSKVPVSGQEGVPLDLSQGGISHPKPQALLPTTKSLSKDLGSQTVTEPEKTQVFQPVSFSTVHPENNLQKAKTVSAVLGFHINVLGSSYSTSLPAAKPIVSGSPPQSKVLVSGQEGVPKDMSTSSQPRFDVQPKLFGSSRQVTETEKEGAVKRKNVSTVTEVKTLLTEEYKSTEIFTKVIGWIGHWLSNHSRHDPGHENKTATQPVTSTAMPYKSSSAQLLISFPLPLPHSPSDKSHSSLDVDVFKKIKMTTAGHSKSTVQSNASHANFNLDLNQESEEPRSHVFDISGNETDLGFPHHPGDSLFKITAEIQHQHVKLREWEKELVEVVKAKITEKMTFIPSGEKTLILKKVILTNPKKLTLTFWLHLHLGGKGMGNFIKTQVKALEGQLMGKVGAMMKSLSVKDVNECQLGIQNCDIKAQCANEFGSYSCQCIKGYEDDSPAAPGTVCIASQSAEIYSLSEQMETLVASLGGVAITLLLLILLLCVAHLSRRTKANFRLREGPKENRDAHATGALPASQSQCGQMLPSLARHMSPRQSKGHYTARDTSSTLELTNITFEQTAI
ncbi:uncharacterized protein [Aquarana catesbeiana]|uniref:uncharacterized protein n=1 Tax=Aquarana catesbeiana TaxID=8400 RepID=UPI003CC9A1E3